MGHRRYVYTPVRVGWIIIEDCARAIVEEIHCPGGDAQERYEQRARELEHDGWTLDPGLQTFDLSIARVFAIISASHQTTLTGITAPARACGE
jgi:hypothetical protein